MKRFAAEDAGQAIVMVAGMMTMLLMFVGLAIDAGQLYSARRTMQEAADAAAYAGAVVLYQNASDETPLGEPAAEGAAVAAAINDATLNGFTNGVDGVTVTVSLPPTSGTFTNNDLYVEVRISQDVRTALVPAQSLLTRVAVRAVAGSEPLNNGYAILSLDRGNTPCSFETTDNADIHLTGGGILVNSSSNTAACSGQDTAARFTIAPSPPNGVDIAGDSSSAWPAGLSVETDQPQQPDPFSGFPKPSTTCTPNVNPCTPMAVHSSIPADDILDAGVWEIEIGGAGNTLMFLRPGIYVLKAGINASGNADLISTTPSTTPACASNCGVFIFNTHSNYPGAFDPDDHTCGPLNLTGNAATNLRAQTTGVYANFLVYQDSACTNAMKIAGNGNFTGTGTIYLPNATFELNGNNATLIGSQVVANQVNLQNGNMTIDFAANTSAQPILPRLAE